MWSHAPCAQSLARVKEYAVTPHSRYTRALSATAARATWEVAVGRGPCAAPLCGQAAPKPARPLQQRGLCRFAGSRLPGARCKRHTRSDTAAGHSQCLPDGPQQTRSSCQIHSSSPWYKFSSLLISNRKGSCLASYRRTAGQRCSWFKVVSLTGYKVESWISFTGISTDVCSSF